MRSGGSRGSRPSSGGAVKAGDVDIAAMMSSGLDFNGSAEMVTFRTIVLKNKKDIERKADGRKCLTCFMRDDMFCPISIASEQIKRPLAWGQVRPDGTSLSPRCGFCQKYFNSAIRYSRVPPVKLEEYEGELGKDEKRLELHRARIVCLVHECIRRGMMSFHVQWDVISKRALRIVYRKSMVKNKNRMPVDASGVLYLQARRFEHNR